jgi:hypothetical protein
MSPDFPARVMNMELREECLWSNSKITGRSKYVPKEGAIQPSQAAGSPQPEERNKQQNLEGQEK